MFLNALIVDQSLCINDGICVKSCPMSRLEMSPDSKGPRALEARRDSCVRCGHCLAVCSKQALEWSDMPRSGMSRARTAPDVSAEQVADWLKSRRSIRAYRETLVDRPLIEQALETARFAPSGHNRQPVSWIVVSGRDKISSLASAGLLHHCSNVLAACCRGSWLGHLLGRLCYDCHGA